MYAVYLHKTGGLLIQENMRKGNIWKKAQQCQPLRVKGVNEKRVFIALGKH